MIERKPDAPEEIRNVSLGHFSVAKMYGGCKFQGKQYHYDAERDTLVRFDVWLRRLKEDGDQARQMRRSERAKWMAVQGDLI